MKCDRCQNPIDPGEEREYLDQILCEDCYMDVLSPVRTCDPWAVHSAKSFEKHSSGGAPLTPIQTEILQILSKTRGLEPLELLRKLGGKLTFKELEREFSALRHMEKVRGEKQAGKVIWRLW